MIQIQAYNQNTDSQVYLDLLEYPDIQVNYSFADIKDPSSRNSDYSQTFKLPFTNANNQFFEQLFEVNISTATFNPQIKTDAIILVNGVNVHKGYLQIKNILTKNKLYEVVVFGEAADLFTSVKDKKLIEAFRNPSTELLKTDYNHLLTIANVVASWSGTLENLDEDATPDILYPIIDWGIQTDVDDEPYALYAHTIPSLGIGLTADNAGLNKKQNYLRPHYLKPAIKLKTLVQEILQNNGFSYTSTFIDSAYFGKLFFQLGTEFEKVVTKPVGGIKAGFSGSDKVLLNNVTTGLYFDDESTTGFYDIDGQWGPTPAFAGGYGFLPQVPGTYEFKVTLVLDNTHTSPDTIGIEVTMKKSDSALNFTTIEISNQGYQTISNTGTTTIEFLFNGVDVLVGEWLWWSVVVDGASQGNNISLVVGASGCNIELQGINYTGEGLEVYIPDNCPDIDITDFLKDLFQRFNLVLVPEKDNPKNLIIEPIIDYLDAGTSKDWTDKLDISKEQTISFPNEYVAQKIHFTDLEDKDSGNTYWQNTFEHIWGHYEKEIKDRDFAQEELTNDSIYSPFMPTTINNGNNLPAGFILFLIHKAYEKKDGGKIGVCEIKPKLFHYSGTAQALATPIGLYNALNDTTSSVSAYPYCSVYDSSPITSSTKVLSWGNSAPFQFSNPMLGGAWSQHTLYIDYWARYLNEIYSEDARIMNCNIKLNETDILNFNFNDKLFIKDTYWRVNKIKNFVVGAEQSTKIELIKIVDLTETECGQEPGTFNSDGTVDFVSTTDGSAVAVTEDCCNAYNYFFLNIPVSNWGGTAVCFWQLPDFDAQLMLQPPKILVPSMGQKLLSSSNDLSTKVMDSSAIASSISNDYKLQGEQVIAMLMVTTTTADLVDCWNKGITNFGFSIPRNTICSLKATVTSVQTDITAGAGSLGSSSYRVYYQAVKNIMGTLTLVGTISRAITMDDGDAGTRDFIYVIDATNNQIFGRVQTDTNKGMSWVATVEMTKMNIDFGTRAFAVYQDGTEIWFQDGDELLYN